MYQQNKLSREVTELQKSFCNSSFVVQRERTHQFRMKMGIAIQPPLCLSVCLHCDKRPLAQLQLAWVS